MSRIHGTGRAREDMTKWIEYVPRRVTHKSGKLTPVYYPGDDGSFDDRRIVIEDRYIPVDENEIFDSATGLIWIRDPSLLGGGWGVYPTPVMLSWTSAIALINTFFPYDDSGWRMPNINEISSILDYAKASPCIDEIAFPNTQGAEYWSGTVTRYACANIYKVDFSNNQRTWAIPGSGTAYVRPVKNVPSGHHVPTHHRPKLR